MFPALVRPLPAVLCAALSFPAVALPQEPSPPKTASAIPMLATERYLFVVHDGVLHQFDIDSLELRHRVRLDADPDPAASAPREVSRARAVSSPGGSPAVAAAMREASAEAVAWLARHQDDDGKWDADAFMKHDTEGQASDGPGGATHDVGVTGLAVLALLADGSTMRSGPQRDAVKKAVKWLVAQQQENGLFGTNASHDFIYDHAIAAYAMCEVFGLSNYELLKDNAQRGIDYLESHRNPFAVWRYQPRDNDNDTSVTSWCILACKSGDFWKLQVDKNALQLGAVWLDQVSDPTGHVGYTKQGERSSRNPGDHATRFPVERGEAMTAAGLSCRFSLGQDPKEKPLMKASADLILSKPPVWDPQNGSIDEYYWYNATNALFQMGGRHWTEWQKKLAEALSTSQRRDGNFAGSWDPVGVWGETGGRVFSTAMLALAARMAARSK